MHNQSQEPARVKNMTSEQFGAKEGKEEEKKKTQIRC